MGTLTQAIMQDLYFPKKTNYEDNYKKGTLAEIYVSNWLQQKDYHVLHVSRIVPDGVGKGTRIYSKVRRETIAPDLFVFTKERSIWVEVKWRDNFTWNFGGQDWTLSMSHNNFLHYQHIQENTQHKVWVFFLVRYYGTTPEEVTRFNISPSAPTGLYGGTVPYLVKNIHHFYPYNQSIVDGKVVQSYTENSNDYFSEKTLMKLATLQELGLEEQEKDENRSNGQST